MPSSTRRWTRVDHGVVDLGVRDVAPPGQHIRVREDGVTQTLIRLVEVRRPDVEPGVTKAIGDRGVDAIRIDRSNLGLLDVLAVLGPDRHPWSSGRPPVS